MKRLLLLLTVSLLFGPHLFAQQAGSRIYRDIAYRETGDPVARRDSLCRLDLCCPTDRTGFATLIWFHGGGLTSGRRELPEALLGQGFAVVGVDYRLVPRVTVAECVEDAAAAAAWVVRHIAEYGGDPRLIFVAGHSAGGYLTSMIGLDKRWLAPYGIDPDRAFAALIPYSGQVVTHFSRRAELGLPDTQPLVDDMAPLNHVRPDCPPMLLLSGDRDHELLGRYEETAYFWRMMQVVGHPDVQLLEFDGFDHGNMPEAGHFVTIRYIRDRVKQLER